MRKTLYLASLDIGLGYGSLLVLFYAASEAEVKKEVASAEVDYEARLTEVKAYPNGFRLVYTSMPGIVEVPEEGMAL
jgi:hypothetical protein